MTDWVYEVQVVGELSETVLAQIHAEVGEVITSPEPVTTVIRGSVADQSAFVGLLDQIHALGLQVRELRHLDDWEGEPGDGSSLEPGL